MSNYEAYLLGHFLDLPKRRVSRNASRVHRRCRADSPVRGDEMCFSHLKLDASYRPRWCVDVSLTNPSNHHLVDKPYDIRYALSTSHNMPIAVVPTGLRCSLSSARRHRLAYRRFTSGFSVMSKTFNTYLTRCSFSLHTSAIRRKTSRSYRTVNLRFGAQLPG